jgi:hypothetical protein
VLTGRALVAPESIPIKESKVMIRIPRQLPDPVPDPAGVRLAASVWDSKTGTVIETSRKLPHTVQQG